MTELTATMIIDRYHSTCGHCHQQTPMRTTHHNQVIGYGVPPGTRGCGARFVDTATSQISYTADILRECRPDLPVGNPLYRTR